MAGTATSTKPAKRSRYESVVQRRYVDGYRVANTVNSFGQIIKVGGCVFGVLVFLGASEMLKSPGDGLLLGLIATALFFVIGIIVAAQGQLLKATLDTAVHSSPFLTDDLRAAVMSLGAGDRDMRRLESDEGRGNELDAPVADHEVATESVPFLLSLRR